METQKFKRTERLYKALVITLVPLLTVFSALFFAIILL